MRPAVILMAYGSPSELADIRAYLEDVRGGRPVSDEAVEELTERYRRIGGRSPLDDVTEAQRAALEAELELPVYVGMKHWRPRIAEAAERALAGGANPIVGIVLAPHYSGLSIDGYRERLEDAVGGRADLRFVESWHTHEPYVAVVADRVRGTDAHVVFTAHSLPARILDDGAGNLLVVVSGVDTFEGFVLGSMRKPDTGTLSGVSCTLGIVDLAGVAFHAEVKVKAGSPKASFKATLTRMDLAGSSSALCTLKAKRVSTIPPKLTNCPL